MYRYSTLWGPKWDERRLPRFRYDRWTDEVWSVVVVVVVRDERLLTYPSLSTGGPGLSERRRRRDCPRLGQDLRRRTCKDVGDPVEDRVYLGHPRPSEVRTTPLRHQTLRLVKRHPL